MKVLVIGSGAREHALINALLRDSDVSVECAPGNAGIAAHVPVHAVTATDSADVLRIAQAVAADLVVIGPEAPLVAGVADALRDAGFAVFGPSAAAAALEGSKAFAKEVMNVAGVPTAGAHVCKTLDEAAAALDEFGAPYVVKDDGLAAGKGVVVTENRHEALAHAGACLASGSAVLIEEYLDGPEVSLFAVTDGVTVVPLQPAQDFKRVGDGDSGPNTGGMGAYSPLPWAPTDLVAQVQREVLQPTIDEMARRGTPFSGLLYAGLALTSRGVRVIEFNARFGDPETQVVLARLRSSLAQLLLASAQGTLAQLAPLQWIDDSAITVVMASQGYPENPVMGATITGLDDVADSTVFHAGTKILDGALVVAGGRVLCVTAVGKSLEAARATAYADVARIHFRGEHHRSDIALKAANGEVVTP